MISKFHRGLEGAEHVPEYWLQSVLAHGHEGVYLFFAISGFILSLPFARQAAGVGRRVSFRDYYLRRLTRIEPPYLIQLAIMMALCVLVLRKLPSHPLLYGNPGWFHAACSHIGASLVYAHGFIFGRHPYPNYVLWSLEIEVQFYLIAPLLARVFFIRNKFFRRALLGVPILAGVCLSFAPAPYRVWASLVGTLHYFLIGFFFADLYVDNVFSRSGKVGLLWDVGWIAAILLVSVLSDSVAHAIVPLVVVLCFLAAFTGWGTSRILRNPWITTVGGMCYTIYMYHTFMISAVIRMTEKLRVPNLSLDLAVQVILLTACILPMSALLFVLFERPFMDRDWPGKLRRAIVRRISKSPKRFLATESQAVNLPEPAGMAEEKSSKI